MSCKCERLCVVCKPLCDMRILLLRLAGVRILCRVCIFLAMWHLRVPSIYPRMVCVLDGVSAECFLYFMSRGLGCGVLRVGYEVSC